MNAVVITFLVVGDKFMPGMHSRQPGFRYSSCEPFTKHKERIQKFKDIWDSIYIYQQELEKACFQHDMAYSVYKDLPSRTALTK